jgi:hypothetical protein
MEKKPKDEVKNWYNALPSNLKSDSKRDKNYQKHFVEPKSMIVCIGGTGSGKTNALLEFLSRKNEAFYEIIIFTGSTTDEPIYNLLKTKAGAEVYDNIDELPELKTFEDNKNQEKLIVLDDFINLPAKKLKKINEYLTSGRKFGFTCFVMAQNYTSCPKVITRNAHYFILFKLNDNRTIDCILKNHNVNGVDKEEFKKMYRDATDEPRNFFMVDLKTAVGSGMSLRHNFLNMLR